MAKIVRTKKGKKKNKVASVFVIILALVLFAENCALGVIWIPYIIEKNTHDSMIMSLAPQTPGAEAASEVSALATRQYIYARLLTEKLARYEVTNDDYSEFEALFNETVKAWETSIYLNDKAVEIASLLEIEEQKDGYSGVYGSSDFALNETTEPSNPFVLHAEAADDEPSAREFAEEFTKQYDKAPAGKKIKTLAEYYNTDAKSIFYELKQTQAILEGAAYEDLGDTMHKWYIGAKTTAAAGKVCAVVVSGGTAGVAAAGTGLVIAGCDAAVSVGATTCEICLGSDNKLTKTLDKTSEFTGIISGISSPFSIASSSNAEKLIFATSTLADAADGKILGGAVDVDNDGTVKLCTFQVSPEKMTHEELVKDIKQRFKKYDGKDIFTKKTAEDIADGIEQYINEEPEHSIEECTDEELNEAINDNSLPISDEEIVEKADELGNEINTSVSEGTMIDVSDEPPVIAVTPELDEITGAWYIDLKYNNMSSDLVDDINNGIASMFGEDVAEAAIENHMDEDAFASGYMNIENTSGDNVLVTLYFFDEYGAPAAYETMTGSMKDGVLKLRQKEYVSGDNSAISDGINKLEMEFFKTETEIYSLGTYSLESYFLNADIDYHGTLYSDEVYWDF